MVIAPFFPIFPWRRERLVFTARMAGSSLLANQEVATGVPVGDVSLGAVKTGPASIGRFNVVGEVHLPHAPLALLPDCFSLKKHGSKGSRAGHYRQESTGAEWTRTGALLDTNVPLVLWTPVELHGFRFST